MSLSWVSSSAIFEGAMTFFYTTVLYGHMSSSALPDYVFDEGERQPKQALKRPKTVKVNFAYISYRLEWYNMTATRARINLARLLLICRIRNEGKSLSECYILEERVLYAPIGLLRHQLNCKLCPLSRLVINHHI